MLRLAETVQDYLTEGIADAIDAKTSVTTQAGVGLEVTGEVGGEVVVAGEQVAVEETCARVVAVVAVQGLQGVDSNSWTIHRGCSLNVELS